MKKIVLLALFFFFSLNATTQVTIGNGPTSNMIFDIICNTWRPTSAPAYLNIGDLLVDLSGMPTTVSDFDCQNPQVCLGPIIVEEPILYASPFQLTLNSCTNVLVYATVENGDFGNIFFTTASQSSGVSDGYVVIGTGIEGINGLGSSFGFYSSAALPIPLIRGPVNVGTLGGVNVQAPKLLAVVADTLDGAFAQLGMPFIASGGSITAFSGQSHAIISRSGLGSYARIGHGSDALNVGIPFAPIDVINEDGNLWVHAGNAVGNKANIGHVTNNGGTDGNISVIIADGSNLTDGHIEINGGNGNLASIGHFSEFDQNQFVSGSITVQAQGAINMNGGSQSGADAMIGHHSPALNIPVQSAILVESVNGTTLNGGSSSAKAQIGHEAHIVDVALSTMTVGCPSTISLLGKDNGPAVIGHKLDDATGLINGGNINVQCGNLILEGAPGINGWTGIGHFDLVGNSSITGDIYITSDGGVSVKGGGSQSFSRIGHDALAKGGTIEILSGGDVDLISGLTSTSTATIICEDSVLVYTSGDLLMQSHDADVLINSIFNKVDVAAIKKIEQQKLGPPAASIEILPFINSELILRAGDDIMLTQSITTASHIAIHTDYNYTAGHLWGSIPYLGDPFFLFGWNPLGGFHSPLKSDNTLGMLLIDPSTTFAPLCEIFELFASNYRDLDGQASILQVGPTAMVDLSGVIDRITIGDTVQALDTIEARKQTVNNIQISNSTLNLDSLFIKANDSLMMTNTAVTTTQGMSLIADNQRPYFPLTSFGALSITQSTLISGIYGIRMYSASRANNIGAGGFAGSTFNGAAHSSCSSLCSTEEWIFYYPFGTPPVANSYMHHYKEPNVALAIAGFNYDIECDQNEIKLRSHFIENISVPDIRIEMSVDGWKWQYLDEWLPPYDQKSIDLNSIAEYGYVRLMALYDNGDMDYSEIKRMPCAESHEVNIYPQPASAELFIDDKKNKEYTLLDIYGNVVLTGKSPMDVSAIKSGVYFVNNDLWNQPKKIIVAR